MVGQRGGRGRGWNRSGSAGKEEKNFTHRVTNNDNNYTDVSLFLCFSSNSSSSNSSNSSSSNSSSNSNSSSSNSGKL